MSEAERPRGRRLLLVVPALVLAPGLAAAGYLTATSDGGEQSAATVSFVAPDPPPALEPTTTTTSAPPTTTTRPPSDPLPVPARPPADPYADVPVTEVGTIEIPEIGVEHTVYEGIWLTVLNVGPGHWPGSAMPGERGNTVFPGHRTTYTRPFHDLDRLAPGAEVTFRTADGVHTYAVRETLIVSPEDLWVVDQTEQPTMTLVACHPKGSARQRIVVKGDLVRSEPGPAEAAAAA